MASSEPSDAEVIAESFDVPHQFGLIFDRHHVSIYRYLIRRVNRVDAEDLTSEVFIRAFDQRSRFDQSYESARPWLFGIARNAFLNHRRRSQVRAANPLFDTDAPVRDHAPDVAEAVDAQAALRDPALAKAVTELHPDIRETLLLFAVDELTYGDIAELLGVPLGTVRSRLGRARASIREQVGQSGRIQDRNDEHA